MEIIIRGIPISAHVEISIRLLVSITQGVTRAFVVSRADSSGYTPLVVTQSASVSERSEHLDLRRFHRPRPPGSHHAAPYHYHSQAHRQRGCGWRGPAA